MHAMQWIRQGVPLVHDSLTKCRWAALAAIMCSHLLEPCNAKAQPNPCGIWEVDGKDDSGTTWTATLVLEPKDKDEYPPTKLKGYFDWVGSNKTGGREYVVLATYDYDTRTLQMRGAELEDADPNIRTSIYDVTMTEQADRLKDGTWKSCGVIPGVWQAKRSLEQMPSKKGKRSSRVQMPARTDCRDGVCEVDMRTRPTPLIRNQK